MRAPFSLFLGFAALAGVAAWPASAQAEDTFPGAIQEAAGMACTPTCLLCHTSSPGMKETWALKFMGAQLGTIPTALLKAGANDPEALKAAYRVWAADTTTDPLRAQKIAALQRGEDPDPNVPPGTSVCGPEYGCGARVAKAPPSRLAASAWVVAAIALGGLLRRRKSRQ